MSKPEENFKGFLEEFSALPDSRSPWKIKHSVFELFLVAISALLCGANNWEEMALFAKEKMPLLRAFFPYQHGHPCKDTLRRFFRACDKIAFNQIFTEWMRSLHPVLAEKVIAIDGKTSRHSFDGEGDPLHLVTAFATEARLVLAQQAVSEKSNEITAIPKLLDMLALDGAIVTIDAMGCQYKIAEKICAKNGHYVLALKGNQGALHEDIQLFFNDKALIKNAKTDTHTDGGHGRIETRTCTVIDDVEWLRRRHPLWQSLNAIVCIHSVREIKGAIVHETRYFITSLPADPKHLLQTIRSHWAIENSLHWSLDMTFLDDQNRTRKDNAPANIAVLRHIAINTLQRCKPPKQSLSSFRKQIGWNNTVLSKILDNLVQMSS
jgi:predicted transposase YbfD/YdcC